MFLGVSQTLCDGRQWKEEDLPFNFLPALAASLEPNCTVRAAAAAAAAAAALAAAVAATAAVAAALADIAADAADFDAGSA